MALTSILEQFNQDWLQLFNEKRVSLRPIFGHHLDEIHHVGSTSISGMLSKPEIDILVVINKGPELQTFFRNLVSLGYIVRGEEPGPPGHWYFSKNSGSIRTHKLHLCRIGHECVTEQFLFSTMGVGPVVDSFRFASHLALGR